MQIVFREKQRKKSPIHRVMAKFAISGGFLVLHFFLLIATTGAQYELLESMDDASCTTPIGKTGECVPIRQCTVLLNLLAKKPLLPETIQFLRSSQCGVSANKGDPNVCCEKIVEYVKNDDNNVTMADENGASSEPTTPDLEVIDNPNLPFECGDDQTTKINGGIERTAPYEFAWSVLLEYATPNGIATSCSGTLLSERYVLTAAHCVSGLEIRSPTSVRLGEYDTSRTPDCLMVWLDVDICTDDPVSVPIEESIVHESYRRTSRNHEHDIALLRLSRRVETFTSYIRPICLPTTARVSRKLWVTGWGLTESGTRSDVKLRLEVSPADPVACSRTYENIGVNLGPGQFCAGGGPGKDLCQGVGGASLMSNETSPDGNQKWTIVGVVSLGSVCRTADRPVVHTKVIDYVPWILGKFRP